MLASACPGMLYILKTMLSTISTQGGYAMLRKPMVVMYCPILGIVYQNWLRNVITCCVSSTKSPQQIIGSIVKDFLSSLLHKKYAYLCMLVKYKLECILNNDTSVLLFYSN